MKRAGALLLGIVALWVQSAGAAERILSFDSVIEVMRDGSMRVTEVIAVQAEGRQIKRGIFRDFPADYQDRFGRRVKVDFEILAVTRDGVQENYFTKPLKNGVRTYIGNSSVFLEPGEYTYTLSYRTNRQLGFFEKHDELYWNVTGTGWDFPIDKASAAVTLPAGVPMDTVRHEAYTGRQGAKGADYRSQLDDENRVFFSTSRPLGPHEGLTIVAMWPKGFVDEPDIGTRLGWFIRDNRAWAIGIGGILLLLGFYGLAWRAVGRDPQTGVIFPHYEPPEDYSPASMRFIRRMGYDHKAFATALVNLAVKGYVKIEEDEGEYTIEKRDNAMADLAPGESVILRKLLPGRRQKLDRTHHRRIKKAINAHKRSLKDDYERIYFQSNSTYFLIGGLISAALFLGIVAEVAETLMGAIMALVILTVVGLSGGKSLLTMSTMFPATGSGKAGPYFGLLAASVALAIACFFAYNFMGALTRDPASRIGVLLFASALLLTNGLFYQLMKAPTRVGRRLLDKIGGFEEYLTVAEEEDLKLRNPPKRTPALFEKYLPFAMALDVEDIWGDKFTALLAAAERDGSYTRPRWYSGSNWSSSAGPAAFAGAVATALAASAAAASSPPGSSSGGSGGGGGGSSGGGGGGGGGGGW
jgi:hypothetical protein